jgi:hypothetical protein
MKQNKFKKGDNVLIVDTGPYNAFTRNKKHWDCNATVDELEIWEDGWYYGYLIVNGEKYYFHQVHVR